MTSELLGAGIVQVDITHHYVVMNPDNPRIPSLQYQTSLDLFQPLDFIFLSGAHVGPLGQPIEGSVC